MVMNIVLLFFCGDQLPDQDLLDPLCILWLIVVLPLKAFLDVAAQWIQINWAIRIGMLVLRFSSNLFDRLSWIISRKDKYSNLWVKEVITDNIQRIDVGSDIDTLAFRE